jgi:hypothetical protein
VQAAGVERACWHDLRHTHVSRLFASGHDPVAIASRIGDSIQTVLSTYAQEYDAARRRDDESQALAALYDRASRGSFMEARGRPQQTPTEAPADLALARAIRDKAQ